MAPHETPSEPVSSSAQARTHLLSVPLFPHNTGTTPPGRPSPSPSPSPTPSQPWWEGDDAEPRSPLDQADHAPKLRNRRSAMSLFSLFSQPKVERAHGYAEQGIDPPSSRRARDPAGSHHHRGGHASPVAHVSRKRVPHETLPLFHAFARATKYGVLPVATTSAETALQKPRSRSTAGSQSSIGEAFPQLTAHDPGSGADNRRAAKTATTTTTTTTTTKHSANRSVSHADEFPSKMFVLINSGYLLQYREDGPSNRLPEKVLELGEESAAFACDLIPGRHHVLQVSRAVDSQGVMLAPTSTLWSKLRFRNTADKLPASRFLLVMPNAKEMEKWMAALRKEIEVVRGKGARADAEIGLWTEEATRREKLNKLKKQPSQSHRSRGRRKSSIAALPENAKGSDRRLSRLHDEEQEQQQEEEEEEKKQSNDDNNKKAEKATLDRIEKQADKLAEGAPPSLHRNELEHDAQSRSSSIAFSEQRKRSSSSIHESRRMSHATVATTIAPSSRANSMTGSAQSEYSNRGSSEATREDMPTKSPYRVLASYTASRRRSVMPITIIIIIIVITTCSRSAPAPTSLVTSATGRGGYERAQPPKRGEY
ncbi:hypothetical protein KC319_g6326 [Hortaea werneckii]|nr:hypothetical protein KC352_g13661 [Hortaea werneckii]KAI7561255.1 hypothetical protein KC317_g9185 [Hortaea werneckii]KAI7610385.1 hypothetical protein KC346_g8755 [Hortaea werneckii]KAI7668657.1 hypothetical protein KC319_g6326 [Hortaea werneckii]KAI7705555.1 hypothetical protein KC322_g6225 [Hortaea werneckii]